MRAVEREVLCLVHGAENVRAGCGDNVRVVLNRRIRLTAVDRDDLRIHATEEIGDRYGATVVCLEHISAGHVRRGASDDDGLLVGDPVGLDSAVEGLRVREPRKKHRQ